MSQGDIFFGFLRILHGIFCFSPAVGPLDAFCQLKLATEKS